MTRKEIKELVPYGDLRQVLRELDRNEVAIKVSNVSPVSYGLLARVGRYSGMAWIEK